MRIILSQSQEEAAKAMAIGLVDHIESHPASVIGLATGKTMIPVYEFWVEMARQRSADHSKCFFFMLDEYLDLPEDHPSSFKAYIEEHLLKPLAIRHDQISFPPVHTASLTQAGEEYERAIKESGGIDIQLLGIGTNGHIGFNEPGSRSDSRTREVHLSPETIESNQKDFKGEMPSRALSMGIATILESKSLMMLATGRSKAEAIKYLQNHHDDPSCPATYLKGHPHFTLVLDPEAASKINLKI
jgi:glucosamine-6-phosphate deaminase